MFYGSLLNYYATIIYCVNKVNQSQLFVVHRVDCFLFFYSRVTERFDFVRGQNAKCKEQSLDQ